MFLRLFIPKFCLLFWPEIDDVANLGVEEFLGLLDEGVIDGLALDAASGDFFGLGRGGGGDTGFDLKPELGGAVGAEGGTEDLVGLYIEDNAEHGFRDSGLDAEGAVGDGPGGAGEGVGGGLLAFGGGEGVDDELLKGFDGGEFGGGGDGSRGLGDRGGELDGLDEMRTGFFGGALVGFECEGAGGHTCRH